MTTNKIKPLGNRILVKRSKATASKGGILLPEAAQEKPKEGIVIAVGPGKRNEQGELEALNIEIGRKVLFGSYAGTEVKNTQDEEDYLILTEDDILGILS